MDQRLLDVIGERSSAIVRLIAPLRYGKLGLALIETLGTQFSGVVVLCKHVERPYFAPAVSIISNYQNFTDCLNENQRWLAIAYTRNLAKSGVFQHLSSTVAILQHGLRLNSIVEAFSVYVSRDRSPV